MRAASRHPAGAEAAELVGILPQVVALLLECVLALAGTSVDHPVVLDVHLVRGADGGELAGRVLGEVWHPVLVEEPAVGWPLAAPREERHQRTSVHRPAPVLNAWLCVSELEHRGRQVDVRDRLAYPLRAWSAIAETPRDAHDQGHVHRLLVGEDL